MKIKIKEMKYEDVLAKPVGTHRLPRRPGILFRTLLKAVSASELRQGVCADRIWFYEGGGRGNGISPYSRLVSLGAGMRQDVLYYCFPSEGGDIVAKTRLAAEELYKMCRACKLPVISIPGF